MGLLFGCSTAVVFLSLISLAFLIIATITPPVIKAFALAEADDLIFGALGYCSTSGSSCVTGTPGYTVSDLTTLTDWRMDDNARDTLVKILVVLPVAAFLTLLSFLFNLFSHFRAFGGSLAFYIIGFIFTLLAFFASAVSAIVTFLLFYPHVKWPAWLLIPASALNLVSVPLVFFALRTNPRSTSDDELDDEVDEANLTDLTDGGNFHRAPSFRMNNIPPTFEKTSSLDKLEPNSTLKVITDDSASSNDQYEKVSMKDYSRSHNNNNNVPTYNGYQGYNLNTSSTENSSTRGGAYTEGTPNLVSSQNYNKGGAIRSEAPKFQPESVRPDFGTTPYPSSYPSAQYNSDSNQQKSIISQPGSGVLGQSNHDESNLSTDQYYDNDDTQSDFTSVSQRAANPKFYRGFNQQGPSLFPNQQQQPMQQHHQQPMQNQGFMPQSQQGYFPSHPPLEQTFSAGYNNNQPQGFQQNFQQPSQERPVKDTSDALLSANPDFAVSGPAFQKQSFAKKANPIPAGGYRPAYKRIQTGSSNKITAASLSTDSPYNFR